MEAVAQRALLSLARAAVAEAAGGAPPAAPGVPVPAGPLGTMSAEPSCPDDPALLRPAGAFVTLRDAAGALRGCLGTTAAVRPLAEVVVEMAGAAARRDPRFPPVRPAELATLEIEISVLEPAIPVRSLGEVQPGRDGLLVVGRGRRGLLLPQVAVEYGLDAAAFAGETCHKAGLPRAAWADPDVALFRFSAEVFSARSLAETAPRAPARP